MLQENTTGGDSVIMSADPPTLVAPGEVVDFPVLLAGFTETDKAPKGTDVRVIDSSVPVPETEDAVPEPEVQAEKAPKPAPSKEEIE